MTAEQLPDPLVPADVDLRDFGFMPLDVHTLLTSSLWIKAKKDPRVAHAAVSLWCEAWHQVPAASLPDDDELLAEFARCDPKEWARIRERALQHFVKCSDGRLYHRHVAAKAVESWAAKQSQRARTKAATEARERNRRERDAPRDATRDEQRHEPPDVPRDAQRDVERDVHQGTGTVKGQGQGDLIPPDGGSGSAQNAAPPTPPPDFDGTNGETLNGRAVVCIASGFELPEQWGFDAEALGFKPPEVTREAEKFRQFFVAGRGAGTRRSVKGWRQSWSNWLDKAAKDRR